LYKVQVTKCASPTARMVKRHGCPVLARLTQLAERKALNTQAVKTSAECYLVV